MASLNPSSDVPLETRGVLPGSKIDGDDDDELEALRAAALASMAKAKEQKTKLPVHLSDPIYRHPPPDFPYGRSPPSRFRPQRPRSPEFVDESYDEEEEVETEVEVDVTDDEGEAESNRSVENNDQVPETKKKSGGAREEDDILNVDCDEVDEFAQFLNEFENDLKQDSKKMTKKTKKIKQRKIVKRIVRKWKKVRFEDSKKYKSTYGRSFSPHSGDRRRSPISPEGRRRREFSPDPRYNQSSQYRRVGSTRQYSRSPSPLQHRYPDRSGQSEGFRTRTVNFGRRGDSAPRAGDSAQNRHLESGKSNIDKTELDIKSKSLPPKSQEEERLASEREAEEKRMRQEAEDKKKEEEFQERLKRLPTPDREKVIARRKKFEASKPIDSVKKVISLKKTVPTKRNTDASKFLQTPLSSNKARGDIKSRIGFKTKPEAKENVALSDLRQKIPHKLTEQTFVVNVRQSVDHSGNAYIEEYYDDENFREGDRLLALDKRPSIFERLGSHVTEDVGVELGTKPITPRKRDLSLTDDFTDELDPLQLKLLKKEKKKEKKEKKKAKKEKKEKKKKLKNQDEEVLSETSPVAASKISAVQASDDDLYNFFENLDNKEEDTLKSSPGCGSADKSDILMSTMKAKNELVMKRIKEVEEDKRMHT